MRTNYRLPTHETRGVGLVGSVWSGLGHVHSHSFSTPQLHFWAIVAARDNLSAALVVSGSFISFHFLGCRRRGRDHRSSADLWFADKGDLKERTNGFAFRSPQRCYRSLGFAEKEADHLYQQHDISLSFNGHWSSQWTGTSDERRRDFTRGSRSH